MNAALSDELLSINAIYTPETLLASETSPNIFILRIPECDVSLRIQFPQDYPERESPVILGPESSGTETRKGEANDVVTLAQETLQSCFHAGEPCIFDLLEELIPTLQEKREAFEHSQYVQRDPEPLRQEVADVPADPLVAEQKSLAVDPQWIISEEVTEKKSVFVARTAHVANVDEAKLYIEHLVATDRKAAKATHNISAWRIQDTKSDPAVTYQDSDDDGETAAGGRLLHLLQLMEVWNVVVVVSRWYGGIQLGPDRFRIINKVAKDAVTKAKLSDTTGRKTSKQGKSRK